MTSANKDAPRIKIVMVVMPYLLAATQSTIQKSRSFKAFPYGLLAVISYLKAKMGERIQISLLDCNLESQANYLPALQAKLTACQPDIVGLSMMFDNSYKYLGEMITTIKHHNANTLVVLGGAAATASYKAILQAQPQLDAVCYSEGEMAFLRLVDNLQTADFLDQDATWITRNSLATGQTPQKSVIMNLNEAIHIDYSVVDIDQYAMQEGFSPFVRTDDTSKRQFFLVTSRGCPYTCSFCHYSASNDKSMRYADVHEVIKHVRFLVTQYRMNVLTLYDDQLLLNQERVKELFRELAQFNLRIECPNGLSVAFLDEELISLMRKAGLDSALLAIESGSPYVLNKIIHKPLALKKVQPVVEWLRKYDFWIQGFFVSGMPGEKDEHRQETVEFIKQVGLDWSGFSLACPSRGSVLFNQCIEKGYIPKDIGIGDIEPNQYIIDNPDYSKEHITKQTYLMNLDVNFVHNQRMKMGDYKVAAAAFRDVLRRYPNHAFAHYFLSKALFLANENLPEAEASRLSYFKLKEQFPWWQEYIDHFGLDG